MILAETATTTALEYPATAVVSTLDGVTTALVAFVLVGLIYPHVIKRQRQFYMIVGAVMLLILLHAFTLMLRSTGFTVFTGILTGLLQIAGLGLAVMSTGGMKATELAGELTKSYEVIRRGEETKEVIIPISKPKTASGDEPERVVYTIDTPPGPAKQPGGQSIPLDE